MGLVHHKTLVCLSDGHTCLPEYRHSVDAFGSTMQSYVPCILDKVCLRLTRHVDANLKMSFSNSWYILCTKDQKARHS